MYRNEYLKFDDNTNLCVYIWEPENLENYKGTIQIAHGMAEYLGRYNEFGEYFTKKGYIVIGADHYAHGLSVDDNFKIGVVIDYDFMDAILKSIKLVREHYDYLFNKTNVLFSHSMGSMAAQRYIELYPNDFKKVIISGTDYPFVKYALGKLLTCFNGRKGKIVYSNFIHKMGVGSFNNKFKHEGSEIAWLTTNHEKRELYSKDKLCGAIFPANYYHSLSKMLLKSKKTKNRKRININSEVLIIAGLADPVGNFGKGPKKLSKKYLKLGLHVHTVLYPQARHECLNEIEAIKNKTYHDLSTFIED